MDKSRKIKLFAASFLMTTLFILTLFQSITVDHSMQRYGNNDTGSLMGLEILDSDTVLLTLMGKQWYVGGQPLRQARESAKDFLFLLPPEIRLTAVLTKLGDAALREYVEQM